MMCAPTIGSMPEAYNEIAMSTVTMDTLGIPHELGSNVQLTLTLGGKTQSYDFVLSGFWRGDTLGNWQEVWLSEAFCLDHAKEATMEALETDDSEGGYQIRIWCDTPFGLQKKADELEQKYGFSGTAVHVMVNPAWNLFKEDQFPLGDALVILMIIFASGYLIVYNVFYLSVNNDIRTYGLLKNVGATGKQLKGIVRRQAFLLSIYGLPFGLLAGYFVSAVIFVLLTVYIGCIKPCRIVSKISPVEAVRMTEGDQTDEKSGRFPGCDFTRRMSWKKSGRNGKITPARMACGNMKRSWKKAVLVVISISLPVIVLNAAWSVFRGFDFDAYLDAYIADGEKSLIVDSRMALMDACRGYAQRYYVILGLMCAVLFVICLLNFFNTSAVTILARSRELSLMEAVGMTQRQLKKMLISEDIFYLVTAILLADTAGTVLAQRVIEKTVGRVFFFDCHMSILPSIAVLPVLAVISAAVPIYNYRKLRKKTVIERLQRE